MKSNELRINNYYLAFGVDLKQVETLTKDKILIDFTPIPLTEEWLLKFGFYKNIDTELFEKGGFQIEISVLKCLFYLPEFGDWHKEIEYVHQLQNLWFALTGEELTITK
jgi:hypothetical protein